MKAGFGLLALAVAIPASAQVKTSGPIAPVIPVTPAPGAASAPTIAGPAGAGTVTLPNVPNPAPGNAVNPGGIIGSAPPVAGSTFSRPILGPPPASALSGNPAGVPTASGFPPPIGPVAPTVTNSGIGGFYNGMIAPPEAANFPNGAPPFFGNVVGTNFVAPLTNFPPRRALSVNLPPGATVVTNFQGVPEAVVPAPPVVPFTPNGVGAPPAVQSGTVPQIVPPAPIAPPVRRPVNPGSRIEVVHPR